MESIGSSIKKRREELNLSIEDVSEGTKIKPHIIHSIEQDFFHELGGYGYAKAMIYTYARFLEMDAGNILMLFQQQFTSKDSEVQSVYNKKRGKKLLIPSSVFLYPILGVIIVIFVSLYMYFHRNGMLEFPLKQEVKKRKTELAQGKDTDSKKVDTAAKTDNGKSNRTATADNNIINPETEFNEEVLRDSTDYVDLILFSGKDNPLNVKIETEFEWN